MYMLIMYRNSSEIPVSIQAYLARPLGIWQSAHPYTYGRQYPGFVLRCKSPFKRQAPPPPALFPPFLWGDRQISVCLSVSFISILPFFLVFSLSHSLSLLSLPPINFHLSCVCRSLSLTHHCLSLTCHGTLPRSPSHHIQSNLFKSTLGYNLQYIYPLHGTTWSQPMKHWVIAWWGWLQLQKGLPLVFLF